MDIREEDDVDIASNKFMKTRCIQFMGPSQRWTRSRLLQFAGSVTSTIEQWVNILSTLSLVPIATCVWNIEFFQSDSVKSRALLTNESILAFRRDDLIELFFLVQC